MTSYVALLRGINVGGRNLIAMPALRACFEEGGFEDVATYIQSGNVLFRSSAARASLTTRIEELLRASFDYEANVVLRSHEELRTVVEQAPAGFGADPATYRYDVLFLKEPLAAEEAIESVPTNPEVDQVHAGPGVLYFSRLASKASRSRMSKITASPIYQQMTIRNWRTTTTLLRMLDEAGVRG